MHNVIYGHLPRDACEGLLKHARTYVNIRPVDMVQILYPFSVDTGHGIATGAEGDFLAVDAVGNFYPIAADVQKATYKETK